MFCKDRTVCNTLEDIMVEARAGPVVKKKQGRLLPVKFIIALELMVNDRGALLFDRYFSGCRVIRMWTASRNDDTESFALNEMKEDIHGIDIPCYSTKTTGPGKEVEVFDVTISYGAYMAVGTVGGARKEDGAMKQNFLVSRPTSDRQEITGKMA